MILKTDAAEREELLKVPAFVSEKHPVVSKDIQNKLPEFPLKQWLQLLARAIMLGEGYSFYMRTNYVWCPESIKLRKPWGDWSTWGLALNSCYCLSCKTLHVQKSDRALVSYCPACTELPKTSAVKEVYSLNDRINCWKPEYIQELLDFISHTQKFHLTNTHNSIE